MKDSITLVVRCDDQLPIVLKQKPAHSYSDSRKLLIQSFISAVAPIGKFTPNVYDSKRCTLRLHITSLYVPYYDERIESKINQESRAVARKPRDAASILTR